MNELDKVTQRVLNQAAEEGVASSGENTQWGTGFFYKGFYVQAGKTEMWKCWGKTIPPKIITLSREHSPAITFESPWKSTEKESVAHVLKLIDLYVKDKI